jgi:hypothetical protein
MGVAEAIIALANITSAGITLLQQAQQVSDLIQKANAEGRTTFTVEEWAVITGTDDAARKTLEDAIRAHGG